MARMTQEQQRFRAVARDLLESAAFALEEARAYLDDVPGADAMASADAAREAEEAVHGALMALA